MKLDIQNFQSHKDTTLDFHPGVNVIIGSSDSGKTAILRALRWVIYNKPTGDAFRRIGSKKTSVQLSLNEQEIIREKIASTNVYQLGDKVFKAFGNDVPDEIKQIVNFDDVNLQQQLDSPYLLSSTPGEVARHFNKIAHLEKIDNGNSSIQKTLRKLNSSLDEVVSQITNKKEQLQKYVFLDDMERDVECLEVYEESHIITQQQIKQIKQYVSAILNARDEQELCRRKTKLEKPVDELTSLYKQRTGIRVKIKQIQTIVDDVNGLVYRREKVTKKLKQSEKTFLQVENLVNDINILEKEKSSLEQRKSGFKAILKRLRLFQTEMEGCTLAIERDEKLFQDLMPDICPLCGNTVFPDNDLQCDASVVDLLKK